MNESKKMVAVKRIIEMILFVVLYRSFEIAGIKKYAVAIVFCALFLFFSRKKQWNPDATAIVIPSMVYIVLGSFAGMFGGNYQMDTIKIILYGILSFALAFSLYTYYGKDIKRIVDIQFLSCCAVYLSLTIVYMVTRFTRVESTFAFVFGIFSIYYAYVKKWKMLALSGIFLYLADKRIALLAVAASLLMLGVFWLFENNKKLVYAVWGLVTGLVYIYIYLIYSGIMDAFCWGANINTNGRVEMYSRMANEFEFSPLFLGKGLGVVENLLEFWNVEKFANLHNDLLKFYIELGFAGLFIYLLSYGVMFRIIREKFGKSKMCFVTSIAIYSMLLYATDNVSIYVMYLLPMYSVMLAVLTSENQKAIIGNEEND